MSYYSNYTLESIRDNIVELASLIVKTSSANEAGKIMAVRKKYANKKFAKISQIPGKYLKTRRYPIDNSCIVYEYQSVLMSIYLFQN